MRLVEQHQIKRGHKYYKECDKLCFLSKNLYNRANYSIRQEFCNNQVYLNYNSIQKELQSQFDYKELPAKVSQQTLKLLDKNWKSFFAIIKDWSKNPNKYLGRPGLPKDKTKGKGRSPVIYTIQAISKTALKKGKVKLSKTNIKIELQHKDKKVKQARIVPMTYGYNIEIIYEIEIENEDVNYERVIGIDPGLNNLVAIASINKGVKPMLINGKPLKSINSYYNKKKAKLQAQLMKGETNEDITSKTSKAIKKLTQKRNNKVKDYLHKSSRKIINYCLTNKVRRIIIGKNKNWKQKINIGKKNNQNFVNIPIAKLINMITYKAHLVGITVDLVNEAYTSKCSFLDNEKLVKHDVYKGRRVKRGMFKTSYGIKINADVNGTLNIIKKAISNFFVEENEIQDFSVSPRYLCSKHKI